MPKHPGSDFDDGSDYKRQRRNPDVVLDETIFEQAEGVIIFIPTMEEDIRIHHAENDKQLLEIVQCWKIACTYAKERQKWTDEARSLLDLRLPSDSRPFRIYNEKYESFSTLQKGKLLALPSPPDFGKNWTPYQSTFKDRLLCLRPSGSFGLPLCTLHNIFRKYCVTIQKPLPHASEAVNLATQSAIQLCSSMGDSFSSGDNDGDSDSTVTSRLRDSKENARILKFEECLRGSLDQFDRSVSLRAKSERHSGIIDGAMSVAKVFVSMREMKGEVGGSGDPYMQIVRGYDLAVKILQENSDPAAQNFLKHGAPMFLLCVNGPNLMVAGGFCDGDKVTIEPLGDICIMLEDCTNRRVEQLTRMLYALAAGINELKGVFLPHFRPLLLGSIGLACCTTNRYVDNSPLGQKSNPRNSKRMLFTASLSKPSSPSITVFVKLVNGRYGVEVHQMLADQNLAPILYGVSDLEGAPKAYVMEYLDPSSWIILSTYLAFPDSSAHADSIWLSITKVLEVLQKNRRVHGDLRAPNILVNVSPLTGQLTLVDDDSGIRRANIKVVDFDWAGDAGKVYYPPSRNPDLIGLTWPGEPGGLIRNDHDRKLVDSWWRKRDNAG